MKMASYEEFRAGTDRYMLKYMNNCISKISKRQINFI